MITPSTIQQYAEAYRRIHGKFPKLRELVEHFDGKLLNVLMCLGELSDAVKEQWRRTAAADRAARRKVGAA